MFSLRFCHFSVFLDDMGSYWPVKFAWDCTIYYDIFLIIQHLFATIKIAVVCLLQSCLHSKFSYVRPLLLFIQSVSTDSVGRKITIIRAPESQQGQFYGHCTPSDYVRQCVLSLNFVTSSLVNISPVSPLFISPSHLGEKTRFGRPILKGNIWYGL